PAADGPAAGHRRVERGAVYASLTAGMDDDVRAGHERTRGVAEPRPGLLAAGCQSGKKTPTARPMIRFQVHPAGPRSHAGRSQRTVQHNPLSAMAITRYNRGSEFDLLRREMSRFFDDFFLPYRAGEAGQRAPVWAPRAR